MRKLYERRLPALRPAITQTRARMLMSTTTLMAISLLFLLSIQTAFAQSESDSIITRTISAESGDTLRSIAKRELGKTGLSAMLANFNGMQESDALTEGQQIRIPLFEPVERQFATVIFAKGIVTKNDEQLVRDDKVFMHELVVTGKDGFASIEFSSGSVVNLQPNTHAVLERLNCLETDDSCLIVLDSARGEVSSDVNRRDGQPTEFTINTPYATAAVRGTYFEMNAANDKIIVGVTEGEVLLQGSSSEVGLDEGFGSIAAVNTPPSDPIALLPAPVYRYIPTRAAKGDEISWWALSDVQQYMINLSADAAGVDVVANYNETNGAHEVQDLEAGEYFFNVRGIDSNGLKGYKAPIKIMVASIDESIDPVNTEVTRQGSEFLVQIVEPPINSPGYEIQVSTTADFADPLSVDIANPGTAIFRLESDKIYTRARVLLNPQTVSVFGETSESN